MAQAATTLESSSAMPSGMDELAMLEEHVDSGLSKLLESHEPSYRFENLPTDGIADRFALHINRPLPALDSGTAKAYEATCQFAKDRPAYALVLDAKMPHALPMINTLTGVSHPNLITPIDAAAIKISHFNEVRHVLFLDRPKGTTLADIIASGQSFNEKHIVHNILTPICDALQMLREQGLSHGRIHPRSIYVDDRVVLSECVSEPQGLSQEIIYEPIERALAMPVARGPATAKSDVYSLAMLTYELMFGANRLREVESSAYLKSVLETGAYHLLTANKDLSDDMADFFRGTLCEDQQERWGLEQVRNWINGKRYNLIHPSLPHESTRPFTFADADYFNSRALANAIHRNWSRAGKEIRQAKLDRWLAVSAHKNDTADRVERIIRATGGDKSTNPKLNNEMCTRLIIALDPNGPIRHEKIALNIGGIGALAAQLLRHNHTQELAQLMESIEFDLPNYAGDNSTIEKTSVVSDLLWKLQNSRMHIKQHDIGFGFERLLYTANPHLPCQSELLAPHHLLDAEHALRVLDSLALIHARDTSLLDRHLSAFLATAVNLNKEIKFAHLAKMPKLRDNPELKALRIISMAQEKVGNPRLVGLATWSAIRVEKLIEQIHNRRTRKKLKEKLKNAASSGLVSHTLNALTEGELTREDQAGFSKAVAVYDRNRNRIDSLSNPKTVEKMSKDMGGRISVFLAYLVLCITVYILIDEYYIGF